MGFYFFAFADINFVEVDWSTFVIQIETVVRPIQTGGVGDWARKHPTHLVDDRLAQELFTRKREGANEPGGNQMWIDRLFLGRGVIFGHGQDAENYEFKVSMILCQPLARQILDICSLHPFRLEVAQNVFDGDTGCRIARALPSHDALCVLSFENGKVVILLKRRRIAGCAIGPFNRVQYAIGKIIRSRECPARVPGPE